ncbi:UNKNOWN [Stylonychia lemnae]|uniref:Uncharacterized protein n=1 Tax=Stylonychia lemnae TaxID=5949 RepID=A0A078AZ68_STYLE|nr:UNKNOWN [Stylonychia lemnae]|eukprot:CDW86502.1 UNKNOWN [Stylonychia lemnae]
MRMRRISTQFSTNGLTDQSDQSQKYVLYDDHSETEYDKCDNLIQQIKRQQNQENTTTIIKNGIEKSNRSIQEIYYKSVLSDEEIEESKLEFSTIEDKQSFDFFDKVLESTRSSDSRPSFFCKRRSIKSIFVSQATSEAIQLQQNLQQQEENQRIICALQKQNQQLAKEEQKLLELIKKKEQERIRQLQISKEKYEKELAVKTVQAKILEQIRQINDKNQLQEIANDRINNTSFMSSGQSQNLLKSYAGEQRDNIQQLNVAKAISNVEKKNIEIIRSIQGKKIKINLQICYKKLGKDVLLGKDQIIKTNVTAKIIQKNKNQNQK